MGRGFIIKFAGYFDGIDARALRVRDDV